MKVIRLTYRDDTVTPNVYLMLFFRFIGIYVYERFFGAPKVSSKDIKRLAGAETKCSAFDSFDADIFIVGKEDIPEYKQAILKDADNTNIVIVIALDEETAEKLPGSYKYQADNMELLTFLVNNLVEQRILSPNEREEYINLADIYEKNAVMQLNLKAKYFFPTLGRTSATAIVKQYDILINKLLTQLDKNKCVWGNEKYMHMQYSALATIYDLDFFCLRNKLPIEYDRNNLLELCDIFETHFQGVLAESIIQLKGQIYDDLLLSQNKAYEQYVECCNEDGGYNSYVYYRKGFYWQTFASEYKMAIKYFLKSVQIYHEYYRAWFKLGFCYQQLREYEKAIEAYKNVYKCLRERVLKKCIRPLEIEHIFKAQIQIAHINEIIGNWEEAIDAAIVAEDVWNSISTTSFFDLMCLPEEIELYQQKTCDNLNIQSVYEKLFQWYTIVGDKERAAFYEKI